MAPGNNNSTTGFYLLELHSRVARGRSRSQVVPSYRATDARGMMHLKVRSDVRLAARAALASLWGRVPIRVI